MDASVSREIRLRRHPIGMPTEGDFELAEAPIPVPAESQVLVRNIYMSVDPYMRGRMTDRKRYAPSFQLGEPLTGGCVGQVVVSKDDKLQIGDYVLGGQGWREYYASSGAQLTKIDPDTAPIQAHLGVVGMPGMTAYVGLLDIGQAEAGETVFVSAASGAVGAVVCQIAKIKGCRVVGSAGSSEKVTWLLREAGVDVVINYKEVDNLTAALSERCPDGIDVYFDNVGGQHLEAALQNMNNHGRIVACGMISQYNATEPQPSPRNLFLVVGRPLRIQGFIVSDHNVRRSEFNSDMKQWISDGRMKWRETIVEGLEDAPKAFIGLFKGENFGKMIVKVGPDPAISPA